LSTRIARRAARIFIDAAAKNTGPQPPPVLAIQTFATGTSSDAVPLAVYISPVFVVAKRAPKVSVTVAGNKL
jgi:hypothetical protein